MHALEDFQCSNILLSADPQTKPLFTAHISYVLGHKLTMTFGLKCSVSESPLHAVGRGVVCIMY